MKKIYSFVLCLFLGGHFIQAQVVQQISVGPSYTWQSYYDLDAEEDIEPYIISNNAWDIAFANTLQTEAGIHVNESIELSFTGPVSTIVLYKAPVDNFDDLISIESLVDTISNNEISWGEGALNSVKDVTNPFDYGWGKYNPSSHGINGTSVYVIKLKNDTYKKFFIESYKGGIYTLKHADLDGTNEEIVTINKSDFTDSHLIFYSFDSGTIDYIDNWDLTFSRYTTMLEADGSFIPYTVSGLLSAPGIKVAQANNVDVSSVSYDEHKDHLSDTITTIGHDFKFYDFTSGWSIVENLIYFIKKKNDKIYKLEFLDFEGSSSGLLTFEKTDLGVLANKQLSIFKTEMKVFPNPVVSNHSLSIVFESKEQINNATLNLTNMNGKVVFTKSIAINRGLNGYQLDKTLIAKGNYIITINAEEGILNSIVSVQ